MAPSVGLAAAGLGLNLFDRIKGPSATEQQRSNAVSQGEQAQAAEIQRQTALNKKMEEMLFQIYGNADQAWKPGMEGSSGPQSQDAFANLVRSKALDRIMGLTGSPGSGLLGQASQQGYLEDAQGHQDLVGSAEALADSVLAKYGNNPDAQPAPPANIKAEDLTGSLIFDPTGQTPSNF
jgi:hypothetical protein